MIRRFFVLYLLAGLLVAGCEREQPSEGPQAKAPKPEPTPSVEMEIQRRLEQGPTLASPTENGEAELAALRRRFYEDRHFTPAWSLDGWPLTSVRAYLGALDRAQSHGLDSYAYGPSRVRQHLGGMGGAPATWPEVAEFDVLLTESLIRYAAHLSGGAARGEAKALGWPVAPLRQDLLPVLEAALSGTAIAAELESLAPRHPQYEALRRALAEYREIEAGGGWTEIPSEPAIERGTTDARIALLQKRLTMMGDMPAQAAKKPVHRLEGPLVQALRRFQKRHGLGPTGRFGPETAVAMNVPAAGRIEQLLANLERLRWFPRDPGERHILVNVPDFRLVLIDDGRPTLELRAIVGEADKPTPLLDAAVTQVIFNPYWLIPKRIAREEILPKIRQSPDYLARNQIEIVDRGGHKVNASRVRFGADPFPYRLRQKPGEKNQLGRVKFVFPNPHAIFIHDTPGRTLFARYERDLSHGCIRIERPADLAAALLESQPKWTREVIEQAIASGDHHTVRLAGALPIHIVYWTAWVGDGGEMEFREDLYGHDVTVAKWLEGQVSVTSR